MQNAGEARPISVKRRFVRAVALCFLVLASLMLAAEWAAPTIGLKRGGLISGGLVLCISANLLSALLLLGRRTG
ncbi:hypothetical protein LNKW23_00140 [Paralimibaculum aggregatum]|uniref:Uncharacterized protein n=1 Tax=Paralimibaculum aggregatum TaxID=3036245 RepID=A0ABQ6LCT9_9RHOB|nr:hypothetical protein [Limibaculum sp. NKW23]GMG80802.1 hypothetical protein LNKW23_00140 [Limibaculum sp. NKW23]